MSEKIWAEKEMGKAEKTLRENQMDWAKIAKVFYTSGRQAGKMESSRKQVDRWLKELKLENHGEKFQVVISKQRDLLQ